VLILVSIDVISLLRLPVNEATSDFVANTPSPAIAIGPVAD